MPLSLTCDCGARFEVEDALAGQSVGCPECQNALKAPGLKKATQRTNAFALASLLLALVGAFTVVGTVAAVILGVVAVVAILRDRERSGGMGFAVAGIALGALFTGLTLVSLINVEILSVYLRKSQMANQLEPANPKEPLEVTGDGFTLTRPSYKWQKAKPKFNWLPVDPFLKDEELLLVQPDWNAYLDVQIASDDGKSYLDAVKDRLGFPVGGDVFPNNLPNRRGFGGDDEDPPAKSRLKLDQATNGDPLVLDLRCDGQQWVMVARVHRARGKLYIVRAFAEKARFARIKDELTKALDGFKVGS